MERKGYVYILTNKTNRVLYIGTTSDIARRIYEHKNHLIQGFTDKYNATKLIYMEQCEKISDAIAREKQLKRWRREKKITLIKTLNPDFNEIPLT